MARLSQAQQRRVNAARVGGQAAFSYFGSEYFSNLGRLGANARNGGTLMSKTAVMKTKRELRRIVNESFL